MPPPVAMISMDRLAENLSWMPISDVLDHAERVWNKKSNSVLALSVVAVFYALAGTRTDLLYNAALLACLHRQYLVSHVNLIIEYMPLLSLCLGATLRALLTFASRSSYESTWPGPPYLIPCKTTSGRTDGFCQNHIHSRALTSPWVFRWVSEAASMG